MVDFSGFFLETTALRASAFAKCALDLPEFSGQTADLAIATKSAIKPYLRL
jgi:hypothetical protein